MLLVFDNCEHVIEGAAKLAADLLRGSRGLRILATSREPLRVEAEQVHRLSTLGSPSASVRISAAEALRFPAVQLFVERAAANVYEFELRDADAASVGDICRKLDGIPLAIEFAAARVDTFGVRSLAARLDDRLRLLTGSRRTAVARHRTMSAALDWSYQLLGPLEQTVLQRLAIFAGGFTMEAAVAVAGTDGSSSDIANSLADLATKSLIAADVGAGDVRFRLLETTRAYALAKLEETGETETLAARYATYYRDFLESASNSAGEVLVAACAPEIDNIRAALTWAFGQGGDQSIAVALAAAAAQVWLEMSLLTECHSWMGRALDLLSDADRGTRREMVLQNALGFSLMFTEGASSRVRAALARASELAESIQDFDYQLRALTGLDALLPSSSRIPRRARFRSPLRVDCQRRCRSRRAFDGGQHPERLTPFPWRLRGGADLRPAGTPPNYARHATGSNRALWNRSFHTRPLHYRARSLATRTARSMRSNNHGRFGRCGDRWPSHVALFRAGMVWMHRFNRARRPRHRRKFDCSAQRSCRKTRLGRLLCQWSRISKGSWLPEEGISRPESGCCAPASMVCVRPDMRSTTGHSSLASPRF